MHKNWSNMSAADLGSAIAQGRINPVELTEYFLDKIATHPLGARIFARTSTNRARAESAAAAARAKLGQRRGPLDGVPISWKDLFDTAGLATEAGSALLYGRTPTQDAATLTTATRAGLVCLGKTHMSELAFSGLGLNPITATPPCINDENAVAGGSSSGAATSVAFGLSPAAIGSDTGGSVRIPAAWNDLVGLKTSSGLLPMQGTLPLCPRFDTIGPIARTVTDCALLLSALVGTPPQDLNGSSLSNARLLVLDTAAMDDLRPRPAAGFADALTRLSRAGAQITHIKIHAVARALDLAGLLFTPEAYAVWHKTIATAPHKMFPLILARFENGALISAADYISAWQELDSIRDQYYAITAGYDALLVPTSPILPPDAQRLLTDPAYYASENLLALRNTRIANLLNQCALTLPTAQPSCGISLMAPAGQEGRLLRLGTAAERALA